MVKICEQLLETPDTEVSQSLHFLLSFFAFVFDFLLSFFLLVCLLQTAIRVGDVFALLIEYFHSLRTRESMQQSYQLIQRMKERNIILAPYLDQSIVSSIYQSLGITEQTEEATPSSENEKRAKPARMPASAASAAAAPKAASAQNEEEVTEELATGTEQVCYDSFSASFFLSFHLFFFPLSLIFHDCFSGRRRRNTTSCCSNTQCCECKKSCKCFFIFIFKKTIK